MQDMFIKFGLIALVEAAVFFFLNWISVYVPREKETYIQDNIEKIIEEQEEVCVIRQSSFNYPLLAVCASIVSAILGCIYYCQIMRGDLSLFGYFIAIVCAFLGYVVLSAILMIAGFLGEFCKTRFLKNRYSYLYEIDIEAERAYPHYKNPR